MVKHPEAPDHYTTGRRQINTTSGNQTSLHSFGGNSEEKKLPAGLAQRVQPVTVTIRVLVCVDVEVSVTVGGPRGANMSDDCLEIQVDF